MLVGLWSFAVGDKMSDSGGLAERAMLMAQKALTKIEEHQMHCTELEKEAREQRAELRNLMRGLSDKITLNTRELHNKVEEQTSAFNRLALVICGTSIIGLLGVIGFLLTTGAKLQIGG